MHGTLSRDEPSGDETSLLHMNANTQTAAAVVRSGQSKLAAHLFLYAIVMAVLSGALPSLAGEGPAVQAFKSFLAETPNTVRLVFSDDRGVIHHGLIAGENYLLYESEFADLEDLNAKEFSTTRVLEGGRSGDQVWQRGVRPETIVTAKDVKEGWPAEWLLRETLSFGLPVLEPGSLKWEGTKFTATVSERFGSKIPEKILGTIQLNGQSTQVERLEYWYQTSSNVLYVAEYNYTRELGIGGLPSAFNKFSIKGGQQRPKTLRTVHHLARVNEPTPPEVFDVPSRITNPDLRVYVKSNGVIATDRRPSRSLR